jgi:xanthine dehydrogenase accessory factor
MYDIIGALDGWTQSSERVVVARTVELHGFGARTAGEALAISSSGATAGSLLAGAASEQLLAEANAMLAGPSASTRSIQVRIEEDDAIAAGFACGGVADVMLQPLDLLPAEAWDAFRGDRPFVVASVLGTDAVLAVDAEQTVLGTLEPPELRAVAVEEARSLLGAGIAASRLVTHGEAQVFVECFVPVTQLLVVGSGMLAEALEAQAALLGWESLVLGDDQEACERRIADMSAADVLVLLTHNFDIDAPILGAALRQGVGYVGALGSRVNQVRRRERLEAFGLSEAELARYRGPVGLDIGAANPAETALAICAEAIAVLRQRAALPLTGAAGPLNV